MTTTMYTLTECLVHPSDSRCLCECWPRGATRTFEISNTYKPTQIFSRFALLDSMWPRIWGSFIQEEKHTFPVHHRHERKSGDVAFDGSKATWIIHSQFRMGWSAQRMWQEAKLKNIGGVDLIRTTRVYAVPNTPFVLFRWQPLQKETFHCQYSQKKVPTISRFGVIIFNPNNISFE